MKKLISVFLAAVICGGCVVPPCLRSQRDLRKSPEYVAGYNAAVRDAAFAAMHERGRHCGEDDPWPVLNACKDICDRIWDLKIDE